MRVELDLLFFRNKSGARTNKLSTSVNAEADGRLRSAKFRWPIFTNHLPIRAPDSVRDDVRFKHGNEDDDGGPRDAS